MKKCDKERLLTRYLLGDLPSEEAANFKQHLDGCASCNEAAALLAPTLRELRVALEREGESKPTLTEERRQQLMTVEYATQGGWPIVRLLAPWVAAAALLILGVGIWERLIPNDNYIKAFDGGILSENLASTPPAPPRAVDDEPQVELEERADLQVEDKRLEPFDGTVVIKAPIVMRELHKVRPPGLRGSLGGGVAQGEKSEVVAAPTVIREVHEAQPPRLAEPTKTPADASGVPQRSRSGARSEISRYVGEALGSGVARREEIEEDGKPKPKNRQLADDVLDLDRSNLVGDAIASERESGMIVKKELEKPAVRFNPIVTSAEQPFSTFAIDVDTASYTLARRDIANGRLPPPEQVRVEEFVNAFDYGDSAPEGAPFRIYSEIAPSPFNIGKKLLRVAVKGRRLGREEQRPAQLTFVVDTSGSMGQANRIGLARLAMRLLLDGLSAQDHLQLVAFDDQARLALDLTAASDKENILKTFNELQCSGSTHLEAGLKLAYERAAANFRPGAENRVILISDGVANLGAAEASEILAAIDRYRRQGITCSIFGVGEGAYNDQMLEQLANRGDGAYRFLDSEAEVKRAFVDDLAATLNMIAKDVKIQLKWNGALVKSYRQLGYENRALTCEQFRDDSVDAGEICSGQTVSALYEFEEHEAATRDAPLGWLRVRFQRIDSGAFEELETAVTRTGEARSMSDARAQLRVAASAAQFAQILQGNPYAGPAQLEDVARLLRPAALELSLDSRVGELLRLVEAAAVLKR